MSDAPLPPPADWKGGFNIQAELAELRARVEQLEKDRAARWNPRRDPGT